MSQTIKCEALTAAAFDPFGDVIDCAGDPDKIINAGLCGRYHDRAAMDFGADGRAGISLFNATPRSLPYTLDLMERHPEGSQAFIPMTEHGFLVTVATDLNGRPDTPRAFLTSAGQVINIYANTWHGVLTPLQSPGLFAVVDRIGETPNLEEVFLDPPYVVVS
ncbi:MAG: ureidoglycolate lyase [Ascidiaceihabitans sp.]|nr:ureidoglycolate lyase [Ascidiaceihabitans sp.]